MKNFKGYAISVLVLVLVSVASIAGQSVGAGFLIDSTLRLSSSFGWDTTLLLPGSRTDADSLSLSQHNDFRAYYEQDVKWGQCPDKKSGAALDQMGVPGDLSELLGGKDSAECAVVLAPLKWSEATGGDIAPDFSVASNPIDNDSQASIKLALKRVAPRTEDDNQKPYLFTNPGGPGESGTSFLGHAIDDEMFSERLRNVYHLASWDPRGVGQSSKIKCYADDIDKLKDLYKETPGQFPENIDAVLNDQKSLADGCIKYSGSLVKYVDTQSTARDLELIGTLLNRPLEGEGATAKINFFGFSYGTELGQNFAAMFPERLGKTVLDGVVDLKISPLDLNISQTKGFVLAFNNFLDACIAGKLKSACPFAKMDHDSAIKWATAQVQKLHDTPAITRSGREFNGATFLLAIMSPLYSQNMWDYLALGISEYINNNSVSVLMSMADSYNGYSENKFDGNASEANLVISCLDRGRTFNKEVAVARTPEFKAMTPLFGEFVGLAGALCDYLPTAPERLELNFDNDKIPPIVLVGNSGDPATPLEQAQSVRKYLKNSVLYSVNSEGHTSYSRDETATQFEDDVFLKDDELKDRQIDSNKKGGATGEHI
ncbi:MAG: alpha/beta hydrolase [Candidatus Ancillula sp.]|jgi:pimeloyl-ACP methyl ester carboxylesterase|nr:alpha/beta hydrolase [Candidatus Ancillula sp.]